MKAGKSKNETDIEYLENSATLIGTKPVELLDPKTGQVVECIQTTKLLYGAKHFWKCYKNDLIAVMESLKGRQFEVFIYIVKKTRQSDNMFIGTYEKIKKGTKCSNQVVAETMKNLQTRDFIRRVQNGVWLVNPYILMKGGVQKQVIIRREYEKLQPPAKKEKK